MLTGSVELFLAEFDDFFKDSEDFGVAEVFEEYLNLKCVAERIV